jgi:hypothetical protein
MNQPLINRAGTCSKCGKAFRRTIRNKYVCQVCFPNKNKKKVRIK